MTVRSEESGVRSGVTLPSQHSKGISRRGFLGFFLLGGIVSILHRKATNVVNIEDGPKEAMFWRKANES